MNIQTSKSFRERIEAIHAYRIRPGIDPTPYWPQMWMWDLVSPRPLRPSMRRIIEEVANYYGVTKDDLKSSYRGMPLARYRQVAMHLIRRLTRQSTPQIAKELGRDHSTIVHGCQVIRQKIEASPELRRDVEALIARLK